MKATQGEMKATQGEMKQTIQGANNEGKETGTQINHLEQKEEINSQTGQNEETKIQKKEERLKNLWENFKHSNIQIMGYKKEKNNSKKLKTYFKK